MLKKDYYEILQVNKDASSDTIKKMYRKLAMKYHPDRNSGDKNAEFKFKELGEAYSVLSDQNKRAAYDQFGHAGVSQDQSSHAYENAYSTFGDLFGDLFGETFGSKSDFSKKEIKLKKNGEDLSREIFIDFEDIITGTEVSINLDVYRKCSHCNGFGTKDMKVFNTCVYCSGSGIQSIQQGFFLFQKKCSYCDGKGSIIKNLCNYCESGRVFTSKKISVKIPQGVDTGDTIRLVNEGNCGYFGGSNGNLYITVRVKKHNFFQRDGLNLFCEVPISFNVLCLGGHIIVPTIYGSVKLLIPESTQTHSVFKIKGKGLKSVKDTLIGDLFCKVIISTPINLSSTQKKLLNDFQSLINLNFENHLLDQVKWKKLVEKFLN